MTDDVWKRDEIDSPCVKICVVHPETRLCIGCHRSVDEIAGWSRMTAGERGAVLAELPARSAAPARRGGRRAARRNRGAGGDAG